MSETSAAPHAARRRPRLALVALTAVAAAIGSVASAQEPPHSAELDAAIVRAAKRHGVPEHLVRRIVMRESRYNPRARNHSFWGLMQISYPTAKSMGFKGTPEQLLNPVTNLAYAVPYLANAFVIAGKQEDAAVRLYASGYYTSAKARGVLGLLRTADSKPLNGVPDEPVEASVAPAAMAATESSGWSLFGSSPPTPAAAPTPQQLAYAATPETTSAAQAQIQAVARPAPARAGGAPARISDKNADDGVAMVAGRDGTLAPPKRWQHDGGTTLIARGEQGLDRFAATRLGDGASVASRRSRKSTVSAQLDPNGAAAQARAVTDAQPMSVDAAASAPADPAQAAAAQIAANEAATAPADAAEKPKHRRRYRQKSADE